ncbi:MAG: phosphoribosylformylglycinamidine cyclo-ligase [Endozoicomonadaceae bacterium]|nr:phosphoribosylformylglycinamidine cyclo-ligase [Endozoicomonadaceae bacterium]
MEVNANSITYKDSGVDIAAGYSLVERIKPFAKKTMRPEVLSGLGGFGAAVEIPAGYKQPVLISATDGVGTKLKLAMLLNQHDTIGIDLVAMCVNDIIVSGAEPLFFLDYYATGRLNVEIAATVIQGIATGCKMAGCALVGGETAEMPVIYEDELYDLAGFCVGIIEKEHLILSHQVKPDDVLIALSSSGVHSNGFSLIHALLKQESNPLQLMLQEEALLPKLLTPTRIYASAIRELLRIMPIHAMSHITGGGLVENLPRTLPHGLKAIIDTQTWHQGPVFDWIQSKANLNTEKMYETFNCGVGMVLTIPKEKAETALTVLQHAGETAWMIGSVVESESQQAKPTILFAGL